MNRTTVVIASIAAGVLAVAGVTGAVVLPAALHGSSGPEPGLTAKAGKAPSAPATATPSPATGAVSAAAVCAHATTTVSTASQLSKALGSAKAGSVIALKDGTYRGTFTAKTSGTASQPVAVCGGTGAVIDGGGTDSGYAVHVDGADHVVLSGFTVRNAQKGVMIDAASAVTVSGLTVTRIGDEGIHVRDGSDDARIVGNRVSSTGHHEGKYGEGIYIGTAESNWCEISHCQPDLVSGALVQGNTVSDTTAESVDIKEGTVGGTLQGNTFDGSGSHDADSWVDVKGNDWTITGNTGTKAPEDGFQTHQVVDGWGTGNRFADNTADVDGAGYGFHLAPALQNTVACDNTATAAAKGLSNVPCAGS
jgi:hypothetical protein